MKCPILLTLSFCLPSVLSNASAEDSLSLYRPNHEHRIKLLRQTTCMHNPICIPQVTVDFSGCSSCAAIPRSTYKTTIDELFYPEGPWNDRANDCETSCKKCLVGMMRQGCNTCTLCSYTCGPLSILLNCAVLGQCLVDCDVIKGKNCSCISSDMLKCIRGDEGALLGPTCILATASTLCCSAFCCILEGFLSDPTKWNAATRESVTAQSSLTNIGREEE